MLIMVAFYIESHYIIKSKDVYTYLNHDNKMPFNITDNDFR